MKCMDRIGDISAKLGAFAALARRAGKNGVSTECL